MVILLPSLAVAGEIISVSSGLQTIDVTLPNPANYYIISGQLSTPTTCWVSGTNGNVVTFSFGSPVDADTTLTVIALPVGLSGLSTVDVGPDIQSYSVTVLTGQSVLPIPYWNTQVWYAIAGNTWTFYFSTPPGVEATFSYMVVGPGQNTEITAEPIMPDVYTATIATTINDNFLPMVAVTWNTALGVAQDGQAVEVQFTNASPSYASTGILVVALPINVSVFPLPAPSIIPVQQPWMIDVITPEEFAVRMLNLFPYPWLSDEARTVGGVAYSLFLSIGSQLNFINTQLIYAWSLCRLDTITDIQGLELFSMDYFGQTLPPQPMDTVVSYKARIMALLLQPKVTRQAIVNALEFAFPGLICRPIEPWNPSDTGYWGNPTGTHSGSFFDYDSEAVPSLWGAPGRRYQGFLEIQLPPATPLTYSLWGFDFGAAYTGETGYFFQPLDVYQSLIGQIINLIQQITAQGTQIWVKFVASLQPAFSVGGSYTIATGNWNFNIQTPQSVGFYLLFCQLNQMFNVWETGTNINGFNITTSAVTPNNTILNYIAVENSTPGAGIIAINQGDTRYQLTGDAVNNVVLISADWNTTTWYEGRSVNAINFFFGTAAPAGTQANVLRVPISGGQAGYQDISMNALTATVSLTVNNNNIPFVIPNWNTSVGVTPNPLLSTITVNFSVPAPASAEIMYASIAVNS